MEPRAVCTEGQVLEAWKTGHQYRLLRRLGGGKFGEVWLAEVLRGAEDFPREVAVKIAHPDLPEGDWKAFEDEPLTLHLLAAKLRERQADAVEEDWLIPMVLEEALDGPGPRFFVETVASGLSLDQQLRDRESLPEPEVVALGEQLASLLRVLHEGLQKSYYDFQPRNLFWDSSARRLTVVDWNLLAPLTPDTQKADLEHVAALLYRLAVGQPAKAEHLWEPSGWDQLTPAFQTFLLQNLDCRAEQRLQDASDMERDLRRLREWWEQPPEKLVEEAERILNPPEGSILEGSALRNALTLLEIARRKGAWDAVLLADELQQRWARETFQFVQDLVLRGMYDEALQYVENASRTEVALPERLDAERWREALKALYASPNVPSSVFQALKRLSDLSWKRWLGRELHETSGGKMVVSLLDLEAAQFLSQELAAWHFLREAETKPRRTAEDVFQAAEGYRKALEGVKALPYGDLLKRLWGHVDRKAEELEKEAQRLKKQKGEESEQKRLLETLSTLGEQEVVAECSRWLRERPGDPFRSRLALQQAEGLLERGNPEAALALVDSVALYLTPDMFAATIAFRSQAAEARLWKGKIAWAERQWTEVLQKDAPFHEDEEQAKRIADVAIAALLPGAKPGERSEEQARLEEAFRKLWSLQARDERWRSLLDVLKASAEHLLDLPPNVSASLLEKLWTLLAHMVSSYLTPDWAREELRSLARRIRTDEASCQSLEQGYQKGREEGARRSQALLTKFQIEALLQEAQRLAKKERLEEAIARIQSALELANLVDWDPLRQMLLQHLNRYQEELQSKRLEASFEEVQRLRKEGHLDLALEKCDQALQAPLPPAWAEKFRAQKSDLETLRTEREFQRAYEEARRLQDMGDYESASRQWDELYRKAEKAGNRSRLRELYNRRQECRRLWEAWRLKQAEQAVQEWMRGAEEAEAEGLI
ncbi:MAG: hypothetical protein ACP5UM_05555, partial [Anaerolineae bacterium]